MRDIVVAGDLAHRLAIIVAPFRTRSASHPSSRVRAKKQVAKGAPQQRSNPPPRQMARPVVKQMAALAEASQIARPVVAGIVIKVRRGEHNTGLANSCCLNHVWPSCHPPAIIAPGVPVRVEPPAVGQAPNSFAVRPAAFLAQATSPLEPHKSAEFWPVYRVKPAHRSDRHHHPFVHALVKGRSTEL